MEQKGHSPHIFIFGNSNCPVFNQVCNRKINSNYHSQFTHDQILNGGGMLNSIFFVLTYNTAIQTTFDFKGRQK